MPSNRRFNHKKSVQDNWTQEETQKHYHEKALKNAKKAKSQESGKKFKRVKILHGYKLVEIKPKNGRSKKSHKKGS